ncbi:MAG: MAPEG family protein [Alphaproteobacteria bacterium]|nr:MAPEG family protein [Alphaproteobacteria bacterium]
MTTPSLSPELFWLTLTALMTAAMWVPYIARLIIQLGPVQAFTDRFGDTVLSAHWAQRAKRAHYNAVENLVVFATLVLIVNFSGFGNSTSALACQIYFYARAAHYVLYTLGVPFLRTLSFIVGVACQFTLGGILLGYIH